MTKTREWRIPMIDFRKIYSELSNQTVGTQKKIAVNSCLEVFFGYSFDGKLRLSFLSKIAPSKIESTKILHVIQGKESNSYWTSFDLLDSDLKDAYLSFSENLIDSITDIFDEQTALVLLKRRFITWKTLFKKASSTDISKEKVLGLFGELLTLKEVIAPTYGIDTAIQAWGGPDMQNKDFTVSNTWYEVKTIGANSDIVHISSLTQLSSNIVGHLVVIRAEATSPEFTGNSFSLIDLIKEIVLLINDESTETLLMKKLQSVGIDVFGNEFSDKYIIHSITKYEVNDAFPRITSAEVPYPEIVGVKYEISVAAINRFVEE